MAGKKKRRTVQQETGAFEDRMRARGLASDRRLAPILEWGRQYFPDHFRTASNAMHRWIIDEVQPIASQHYRQRKKGVRLSCVAPRGAAKSTVISFLLPLWAICHGNEAFIVMAADTTTQAKNNLRRIKNELEANRKLREDYPWSCGRGEKWTETDIVTRGGVRVVAVGSGSGVRGLTEGADRPTMVIADDPEGERHKWSEAERKKSRTWFFDSVMKLGQAGTVYLVAGTVLHDECLVAHIDENATGWRTQKFRAIQSWPNMELWGSWEDIYTARDNPNREDDAREFYESNANAMTEGADLLWPDNEAMALYSLMCQRIDGGKQSFEQEMQGEPMSLELCEFDRDYFGEWLWWKKWPHVDLLNNRVISLDPSKGESDHGDFNAITRLARTDDGLVIAESDCKKNRHTPVMISDALDAYVEHRAELLVVETIGFQSLLLPLFKTECKRRRLNVNLLPVNHHKISKAGRIRQLEPILCSRRLRLIRRSDTHILEKQLKHFPQGHDDAPDSLQMGIRAMIDLASGKLRGDKRPLVLAA